MTLTKLQCQNIKGQSGLPPGMVFITIEILERCVLTTGPATTSMKLLSYLLPY